MAVVGIDLGTQSLKAVVVDDDLMPHRRGEHLLSAEFPASRLGRAGSGAVADRVATGDRRGACRCGDDVGRRQGHRRDRPARRLRSGRRRRETAGALHHLDGSPGDGRESPRIDRACPRADRSGPATPTHMAAKIAWMRTALACRRRAAIWHQPVSFVVAALCGRAVIDHALASTTMLYGLAERDYADDLLAAFGVDRQTPAGDRRCDRRAGAAHERRRGIDRSAAGTPVAVGTGDDFANAIGVGVVEPGIVICNLGTGEVVGAVRRHARSTPKASSKRTAFSAIASSSPTRAGCPAERSPGSCRHSASTRRKRSPRLAAEVPAGSDDLLFLPALSGAMAPRWVAGARGAFYGLTTFHEQAACARALLEGCAFAMRDVVDRLDAMGVRTDRIRLTGGGAQEPGLGADPRRRRRAAGRISGPPHDAAPLGAAILGAVAAGLVASAAEAATAVVGGYRTCEPDPAQRSRLTE